MPAPGLQFGGAGRRRVRAEPGWGVVELATGHDAMVSAPEELSAALLDCAQSTPSVTPDQGRAHEPHP